MKKPRPINRIGRKRRAAGWAMLALGVIVAGVWMASGWCQLLWNTSWYKHVDGRLPDAGFNDVTISRGAVEVSEEAFRGSLLVWQPEPNEARITALTSSRRGVDFLERAFNPLPLRWHAGVVSYRKSMRSGHHQSFLRFVVWPIPVLLWGSSALLFRSGIIARRRAVTNACPKCGYSLAGLAANAPCSECGRVAAVSLS